MNQFSIIWDNPSVQGLPSGCLVPVLMDFRSLNTDKDQESGSTADSMSILSVALSYANGLVVK